MVVALGVTLTEARAWFGNTQQTEAAQTSERLSIWFWQHTPRMLGEDPAVNAARLRAVRATTALVEQPQAQERRSKAQRKENARKHKRERQQTQRDAWAQVATEPDKWVSALSAIAQDNKQRDSLMQTEQAAVLEVVRPMDDDPMVPQGDNGHGDKSEVEDMHWSPACTHMATSDDNDELIARGAHTHVHTNGHWSPACTHIGALGDEFTKEPVQCFLAGLSDDESVLDFLLDCTKVHACMGRWVGDTGASKV